MQFANEPAVQTALAELVVADIKRATTSQYRWYEDGAERLPVPGDLFVVLDGARTPRCVCRTVRVDIVAFGDVDEAFAFDEGEDDRSLASWRAIHRTFFQNENAGSNFVFSDATRVVLHRFERVAEP